MPDVLQTTGAFNLFSLYIMMILLNVLDPDTYEYPDLALIHCDQNRIPLIERTASMYARGKAEDLLDAFFARYQVVDSDSGSICDRPFNQIILPHLVRLRATLLKYKEATLQNQSFSNSSCNFTRFQSQLDQALECFDSYVIAKFRFDHDFAEGGIVLESLGWDYSRYCIIQRPTPDIPFEGSVEGKSCEPQCLSFFSCCNNFFKCQKSTIFPMGRPPRILFTGHITKFQVN